MIKVAKNAFWATSERTTRLDGGGLVLSVFENILGSDGGAPEELPNDGGKGGAFPLPLGGATEKLCRRASRPKPEIGMYARLTPLRNKNMKDISNHNQLMGINNLKIREHS